MFRNDPKTTIEPLAVPGGVAVLNVGDTADSAAAVPTTVLPADAAVPAPAPVPVVQPAADEPIVTYAIIDPLTGLPVEDEMVAVAPKRRRSTAPPLMTNPPAPVIVEPPVTAPAPLPKPKATTTTAAPKPKPKPKVTTTTAAAPKPKPAPATTAAPKPKPKPKPKPAPATTAPVAPKPKPAPATTQPAAPKQSYTHAQVQQIIRDAWPDDLEDHAIRIAWRESNWKPNVRNYCCYGLFQINWAPHKSWLKQLGITSAAQLYDPVVNAQAAFVLYQRAGGWQPWSQTRDR